MKWTWIIALGAIAGGVAVARHRQNQKAIAEAELWAEATDPVARFGGA